MSGLVINILFLLTGALGSFVFLFWENSIWNQVILNRGEGVFITFLSLTCKHVHGNHSFRNENENLPMRKIQ